MSYREWIRTVSLSAPTNTKVFVAGGASTDLYLGWTPRDIDVFLIGYDISSWQGKEDVYEGLVKFHGVELELKNVDYYGEEDVDVMYTTTIDGMDVDLIFLNRAEWQSVKTGEDLVAFFDMSVAKSWIEDLNVLDWNPVLSHASAQSIEAEAILYSEGEYDGFDVFTSSREQRIHKYKNKFPGWKMYEEL